MFTERERSHAAGVASRGKDTLGGLPLRTQAGPSTGHAMVGGSRSASGAGMAAAESGHWHANEFFNALSGETGR